MDWAVYPRSRWALRQAGALLLVVAYAGGRDLAIRVGGHFGPLPLIAYGEALLVCIAGSMGGALLFWGRHLFDRVTLADRWQSQDENRASPSCSAEEDVGPFRRVLPCTVPHETAGTGPFGDQIPQLADPRPDIDRSVVIPRPKANPHQADVFVSTWTDR